LESNHGPLKGKEGITALGQTFGQPRLERRSASKRTTPRDMVQKTVVISHAERQATNIRNQDRRRAPDANTTLTVMSL
jgi:hypothetical protein